MFKLFFASFMTLGLLFSFVFTIVLSALLFLDVVDLWFTISVTVLINLGLWLLGPMISDFVNRRFHKAKFLSHEELSATHPEVAEIINQVCTQYQFAKPKVGIIPDNNPTAFTYGSARFNSRIILTEGMFHYLNPSEVKAVVAHELGHIVHRDFIIMMIATSLLQILYQLYATMSRAKGKKSGSIRAIGFLAFILYQIGIYLMYYLSRTREYLADQFAARYTSANDLANALIKIAYGIVAAEDTQSGKDLLRGTRHLGIFDVANAKHYGTAAYIAHQDPNVLAEVMVYDKVSPWAFWLELSSTHPLPGKRISSLSKISLASSQPFTYDIDSAIARLNIDRSKLLGGFAVDMLVKLVPVLLVLTSILLFPGGMTLAIVWYGVGLVLQIPYKFSFGSAMVTTVIDQMRNPYASPITGIKVSLNGQVVGRGVPGFVFGDDLMFQDSTGLVYLQYNSGWGFIGNIIFALKRVKSLIGTSARAEGWFYRSTGSMMSLASLESTQGVVRSHPILWTIVDPINWTSGRDSHKRSGIV